MKGSFILMVLVIASLLLRMHNQNSKPAAKASVSGTIDISTTEDLENFHHLSGSPANTFDMYEKRIQMSINKDFNGNRKTTPSTDTDLPKTEKGECDRVTLVPGDGKLGTFKEDVVFYSKALSRLVTLSSEHEIQLVDGTWEGYRNGRDVKFVASPRGIEQIKSHLKDEAKTLLAEASKVVTKEVEAAGGKDVSFTANLDDVQISNDPVTANLNMVKIHETGLTRVVCKYHGEGTKAAS